MSKPIFTEIDAALAQNDVRRAEVAIARQLRGKNTTAERAALLYRRAKTRLIDARPDDALEDLETSLALVPDRREDVETLTLYGDIHFSKYELAAIGFADRQDTDNAIRLYQQVIAHPDNAQQLAWVYYQLGRIELSLGNEQEARVHFSKTLDFQPNPVHVHALAYERLGFIALLEDRHPEQALQYFEQAIQAYPQNQDKAWLVGLHIRMSRAHLNLHQYEQALEIARQAIRDIQSSSNSSHREMLPEAHLAIADVMMVMSGYEEDAIEHYLRFLQSSKRPPGIDVTWSQVHENIGQLSFRLERYQQAIQSYNKALEHNPYHPWEVNLQYQIARCYYRLRAYESTLETLKAMHLTANDDNAPITDWRVFNLWGNAAFALERYQEARDAYQQAVALAPVGTDLEKTQIYLRFASELSQSA